MCVSALCHSWQIVRIQLIVLSAMLSWFAMQFLMFEPQHYYLMSQLPVVAKFRENMFDQVKLIG